MKIKYKFVEFIPDIIEAGTIYISIPFAIAVHKCCCGCNNEVVTPFSPVGWQMTFDGESISLYPSIGNWGSPCQSHYWISHNNIIWAKKWSQKKINNARKQEEIKRQKYYQEHDQEIPTR
ncbi:MAG: DUF6527 family protein [Anaerolineaceae bacterium]